MLDKNKTFLIRKGSENPNISKYMMFSVYRKVKKKLPKHLGFLNC